MTFASANLYRAPLTYRSGGQLAAHLFALYLTRTSQSAQQSPDLAGHGSRTCPRDSRVAGSSKRAAARRGGAAVACWEAGWRGRSGRIRRRSAWRGAVGGHAEAAAGAEGKRLRVPCGARLRQEAVTEEVEYDIRIYDGGRDVGCTRCVALVARGCYVVQYVFIPYEVDNLR